MPRKNKPTVIIDTNIFISAIIRGGTPYKILSAWRKNKFILITSYQLLEEITEVLNRDTISQKYHINHRDAENLIDGIKLNADFITPLAEKSLPIRSRDPKDNKLLACALGGNVNYLITGDEDLLVLNGNPALEDLQILSVKDFTKLLKL